MIIDFLAFETDRPGLDRFQSVDAAKYCTLAGAAGTDDNDFFALRQLQIEILQYFHRAKRLEDMLHFDDTAHCRAILLSSLSAITMNTEFMIR